MRDRDTAEEACGTIDLELDLLCGEAVALDLHLSGCAVDCEQSQQGTIMGFVTAIIQSNCYIYKLPPPLQQHSTSGANI